MNHLIKADRQVFTGAYLALVKSGEWQAVKEHLKKASERHALKKGAI